MIWRDVSRNWNAYVPAILSRWPRLDEDDVAAADGNREALAAHMADTFGYDISDARASIDDWIRGEEPVDVVMDEYRDNVRIFESRRDIPAGEDVSDDDSAFGDDRVAATPMGRA